MFIINNNGYHSIRQTQANLFQPPFVGIDSECGLEFPDFQKIADAFRIKYVLLNSEKICSKIVERVLNYEGACICEVIVDEKQNFEPKSSSKVLPDGMIVSPSLDDMFPFLDRSEFKKITYGKEEI